MGRWHEAGPRRGTRRASKSLKIASVFVVRLRDGDRDRLRDRSGDGSRALRRCHEIGSRSVREAVRDRIQDRSKI